MDDRSPVPVERVEKFGKEVDDDASSIRSAARGDDLPKGYFYSFGFLGAVAVSSNKLYNSIFS